MARVNNGNAKKALTKIYNENTAAFTNVFSHCANKLPKNHSKPITVRGVDEFTAGRNYSCGSLWGVIGRFVLGNLCGSNF